MSNNTTAGIPELFSMLESNKSSEVDETKKVFHDHFLSTKDNWLVNGLFDYYMSTNSIRATEVLAGVREPHDKHLLDRLTEALVKPNTSEQKVQTLTLLGHVVRKQPTWLYRLATHQLFKEILKLLKVEGDTLSLMSALFLLVTLLPMLPVFLGPHLQEIFEVFARLTFFYHNQTMQLSSTWNSTSFDKDKFYLLHLQVGLYSLFHRLYAMYPCNFLAYLQQQYQREQEAIFVYIIKPMLESVRMHPLLVTMSKDMEITSQRWKKMEHHDVVAECGRFALDRYREEIIPPPLNPRFTPNPDYSYPMIDVGLDDTFWSPSMMMPPHSPPLQTQPYEIRSTPSTPGNKSRTSPPEAAVEATPETTPVKDSRQISLRQTPIASPAVRALTSFGNGILGVNSRPSTPNSTVFSSNFVSASGDSGINSPAILSQKLERVEMEIMNTSHVTQRTKNLSNISRRLCEVDISQNGKNDSWKEDQEVSEIVNARDNRGSISRYVERRLQMNDFGRHSSVQKILSSSQFQRADKESSIKVENELEGYSERNKSRLKQTEEIAVQTTELIPYEHLLKDLLNQRNQEVSSSESRLSPATILDRYIETCARTNNSSDNRRSNIFRRKNRKKFGDDDVGDESCEEDGLNVDCVSQQLQLMQMQLQFERQRREVHAERNRRLLGKLRESRVSEEDTIALYDRLRILEKEAEGLRIELERSKTEARLAEERYVQVLRHSQAKCLEEQQQNQSLKVRIETLELELKNEKKKVLDGEKQIQSLEANVFDAGHRLRGAIIAADHAEELKKKYCALQKRFMLFREAQTKIEEVRTDLNVKKAEEETVDMLKRSYVEELQSFKKQVESGKALVEAFRNRLVELENKEARKETQLIDQQKLLLEAKERHEAELEALESKYKAQMEINLLLQGRILELHGKLEAATTGKASIIHKCSPTSPKDCCSPALSASLASSSESGLAFMQSNYGIMMNDCDDPAGEMTNLQTIAEPSSKKVTTPSRSNQNR